MFKLVIAPQAQKELKKLKKTSELAIKLALEEIKDDPTIGKRLGRDLSGRFSFRVGVFRIIYKINEQDKIVNVFSVGHRSSIYN